MTNDNSLVTFALPIRNHYELRGVRINRNELENSIMTRLRENGLKLTSQRIAVITELVGDRTHPSALDIYQKARERVPTLSLSTVYHILSLLKKHHLIKELEFEGIDNRYEADTNSHLNLVCSTCGKIEDFVLNLPPAAIEMVHKETGFRTIETRIEYYGLCRECQRAK